MANHTLTFELFYDGGWHSAPVYVRDGCKVKRGTDSPGSDSEPASAFLTLDNRSGLYSPRSIVSTLYGKIGQNTKARLTIDSDIRLVGEVASWEPGRAIKGDAWTKIQVAGVLQRIGRGTDPINSAVRRSIEADNPIAYWTLADGKDATQAASALTGGAPLTVDDEGTGLSFAFGELEGIIPGEPERYPNLTASGSFEPKLVGAVPAPVGTPSVWQLEFWECCQVTDPSGQDGFPLDFTITGSPDLVKASVWLEAEGRVNCLIRRPDGTIIIIGATGLDLPVCDGNWHYIRLVATQVSPTNMTFHVYFDGSLEATSGPGAAIIGFPATVKLPGYAEPFSFVDVPEFMGVQNLAITAADVDHYAAGLGYLGETAADRFERLCLEQAITSTVVGDPDESVAMGAQRSLTLLEEFDEVARTDDASIFETRTDIGLTMRTGESKLNQEPAFTISYIGQVQPPLKPVIGDEGIRNDVTASSPSGSTGRVQQLTGPHNVQLPEDDPQGVGRYTTRIDVNPETNDGLADAAGWRVNLGTYAGTWYAKITADLDADSSITADVAALDIGDVLALENLPVDEALDVVEGIIIGIEEDVEPKRRLVTFFCVPADPYRVGILAETSGDTDPFLGHLDTDGSTTNGATLAGAATFSVATPSGPLWTTVADDFPFDVIVGGQRVSVSSISGGSSPQTFTVQVGGLPIAYPIPSGSAVNVHQPIILAL